VAPAAATLESGSVTAAIVSGRCALVSAGARAVESWAASDAAPRSTQASRATAVERAGDMGGV
jgi:hypothetical protein